MRITASSQFRIALRGLRLKFNLIQKQIADIAEMAQADYSDFETGKRKLDLDNADNLSTKVWGVPYTNFVAFANKEINIEKLPAATVKIIKESGDNKLRDTSNLLANELDRLISDGHFASPTTSKLVHLKMDDKLANRITSEITSLLGRSPRNRQIISIGKYGSQKIYIHKDYAAQYEKMTNEELAPLIEKQEDKDTDSKQNKGNDND